MRLSWHCFPRAKVAPPAFVITVVSTPLDAVASARLNLATTGVFTPSGETLTAVGDSPAHANVEGRLLPSALVASDRCIPCARSTRSNDCGINGGDFGSGGFSGGPKVVPEPSTLALLGSSCLARVGFVRHRQRAVCG